MYNISDNKSKQEAIKFLKQRGYKLISDDEVYTYDLRMKKGDKIVLIEVEHKRVWGGDDFPYPTVDVPYRKIKNEADIFIMFNNDYTVLFITPMDTVKESPTSLKNTKYTKQERFFNIPLNKGKFIKNREIIGFSLYFANYKLQTSLRIE